MLHQILTILESFLTRFEPQKGANFDPQNRVDNENRPEGGVRGPQKRAFRSLFP